MTLRTLPTLALAATTALAVVLTAAQRREDHVDHDLAIVRSSRAVLVDLVRAESSRAVPTNYPADLQALTQALPGDPRARTVSQATQAAMADLVHPGRPDAADRSVSAALDALDSVKADFRPDIDHTRLSLRRYVGWAIDGAYVSIVAVLVGLVAGMWPRRKGQPLPVPA